MGEVKSCCWVMSGRSNESINREQDEEKRVEEEEKRRLEEKERQEHEEYLKMKAAFRKPANLINILDSRYQVFSGFVASP